MKKLCCETDAAACEELRRRLNGAGIPCELRSDDGASLFGTATAPHALWVADEWFEKAWELLNTAPAAEDASEAD